MTEDCPGHRPDPPASAPPLSLPPNRRSFLARLSSFSMLGGLIAGYGACIGIAGRFLYPARPRREAWMFAGRADEIRVGEAFSYRIPAGEAVTITRQGSGTAAEDFVALSSTCPHLGCKVHWEAAGNRFFCPCHGGVFTPSGKAIAGPPADAGQTLPRYRLKVEGGLLFILVPLEQVS